MPTHFAGNPEQTRALNAYIKLQRAAESSLNHTTAHLSRFDLTVSQFAVLEALYHLGTLSQSDLARKLLKSTGNISAVLKHIEKRGLLSRERNPDDNRFMKVCLTDNGRALIESLFDDHVTGIVKEMAALTPAEQDQLARLCKKLGLRLPD